MKPPKFHVQPLRVRGLYFVVDHKGIHHRTAMTLKQAQQIIADLIKKFTSSPAREAGDVPRSR